MGETSTTDPDRLDQIDRGPKATRPGKGESAGADHVEDRHPCAGDAWPDRIGATPTSPYATPGDTPPRLPALIRTWPALATRPTTRGTGPITTCRLR